MGRVNSYKKDLSTTLLNSKNRTRRVDQIPYGKVLILPSLSSKLTASPHHMPLPFSRFYQVYSGTNQNYKVARLEENTTYQLRICASNEAGTGPFSPTASLSTTKAPPPLIKGMLNPITFLWDEGNIAGNSKGK